MALPAAGVRPFGSGLIRPRPTSPTSPSSSQTGDSAHAGSGSADEDQSIDRSGSDEPSSERLPGLGAAWQADNWTWKPIRLGLGDEWPPSARSARRHSGEPAGPGQADTQLPQGQRYDDPLAPDPPHDDQPPPRPDEDGAS